MTELRKFYYFTVSFLLVGLSWVGWNLFSFKQSKPVFGICILKRTTGLACPSCGTTRSILHLLHGDFSSAVLLNPLGILAFIGMMVIPFCILYDYYYSKRTLWNAYAQCIHFFQNKKFSFVVVLLVLLNWFWNIQKGV